MAFLDNSGDIILDAVLTDLGRKRMAEGKFSITQFALGDDEIDYSLYNKSHPSGSAYYDLEILQTPVFEAFTRENSNINYGLLTFDGNTDILYLPRMVLNQKTTYVTTALTETSGIVYFAVNGQTYDNLTLGGGGLTTQTVGKDNDTNHQFVFETGIDNSNNPAGGSSQRDRFLVNPNLIDFQFTLVCDGRFLTSVRPIDIGGSTFSYPENSSTVQTSINLKADPIPPTAGNVGVVGQRVYILDAIDNLVYDRGEGGSGAAATSVSEINGPRGRVTAFNFAVSADLQTEKNGSTPAKFSLYGRTAISPGSSELPNIVDASGSGTDTYDILDTIVYLNGNTTGANTQLIVRLIRQAS